METYVVVVFQMPSKKKPKFAYSHEDLFRALEAVKGGESVNMASKRFGIPQSTLDAKVRGKNPIARKMGPQPILGLESEELLVNWIKGSAERGFPVNKLDLVTSAKQIAKNLTVKDNIVRPVVGTKWLSLFLNRHPEMAVRTAEKLGKVRSSVSEKKIRDWFLEVLNYIEEQNLSLT